MKMTLGLLLALGALALIGCGPNYSRIADSLRERNFKLEQQLEQTQQLIKDQQATLQYKQEQLDAQTPRVATLPPERLAQLFTVTRVELRSGTDLWDWEKDQAPDGFRVFFRPYSDTGDILPASGQVTIEVFDLAIPQGTQRLGKWTFTPADLKKSWYGSLGLNHFALNCPLEQLPQHRELTFKLQFIDALTGQVLTDQKQIAVHLPSATPPQ